jgi:hypothetical protein
VLVRVSDHRTVAEAARSALSASAPVLLVGKSLASDPAFATSTIEPTGSTTKQAITQLRQYVDDDVLRHDGSTVLTSQALALRTLPGADGPRVRSTGRADALKAASWCLDRARQATEAPGIF